MAEAGLHPMLRNRLIVLGAAALLALSGCSDDSPSAAVTDAQTRVAAPAPAPRVPLTVQAAARAYDQGVTFLERWQGAGGMYEMYFWKRDAPDVLWPIHAHFTGFWVTDSLRFYGDQRRVQAIAEKMRDSLYAQLDEHGLLRYAPKDDSYWKAFALEYAPPDKEDTGLALEFVHQFGWPLPKGAVDYMLSLERPDGNFPNYLTSLNSDLNQHLLYTDFEAGMSISAFYGLRRVGVQDDKLCKVLADYVQTPRFEQGEFYYYEPLVVAYYYSRAYRFGPAPCLRPGVERLARYVEGRMVDGQNWGNSLHTAFALLSLMNFGVEPRRLSPYVEWLLGRQRWDGGWEIAPMFTSPRYKELYGSRPITTAFVLQVLGRWLAAARPPH
jgi:hypothetical protein